jgi:hypothetical protein
MIELGSSRYHSVRSEISFQNFVDLLEGNFTELDLFLGRPMERMSALRKFWLADHQIFEQLLVFVLKVFFGEPSEAYSASLYRRIYCIDRKDTGVVNTWTNVNRYGSR